MKPLANTNPEPSISDVRVGAVVQASSPMRHPPMPALATTRAALSLLVSILCGCARSDVKQQQPAYTGREATLFHFSHRAAAAGEHFLYVKNPGNIGPVERGDRFENPQSLALKKDGVGRVTGGGS
jgi:hypothetical protein